MAEYCESSRLPEVGEVPHQTECHIFPRRQFGKSKVVSCVFQRSLFGAFWVIFFMYVSVSNLHFPKMKCCTGFFLLPMALSWVPYHAHQLQVIITFPRGEQHEPEEWMLFCLGKCNWFIGCYVYGNPKNPLPKTLPPQNIPLHVNKHPTGSFGSWCKWVDDFLQGFEQLQQISVAFQCFCATRNFIGFYRNYIFVG